MSRVGTIGKNEVDLKNSRYESTGRFAPFCGKKLTRDEFVLTSPVVLAFMEFLCGPNSFFHFRFRYRSCSSSRTSAGEGMLGRIRTQARVMGINSRDSGLGAKGGVNRLLGGNFAHERAA